MWKRGKISFIVAFLEISITIVMVLTCEYEPSADAADQMHSLSPPLGGMAPDRNPSARHLRHFSSHHLLPLLGMGCMYAGLPTSGSLSGLAFHLMVFTFACQWSLVFPQIFTTTWPSTGRQQQHSTIGLEQLIRSSRMATMVCITNGLLHRKLGPIQSLTLACVEVPLISIMFNILHDQWKVADTGDAIGGYVFAIYYGVSIAYARSIVIKWRNRSHRNRPSSAIISKKVPKRISSSPPPSPSTSYPIQSNGNGNSVSILPARQLDTNEHYNCMSTMMGIMVIYSLFPSVISSHIQGDRQHRLAITSYLSISASTLSAYTFSALMDQHDRLSVDHIRCGVLSGGIVMACIGDHMIYPYTALLIGITIGTISCASRFYFGPHLIAKVGLYDDMGLHSSIGIPALISGLLSAGLALIADESDYGFTLYELFPARAPLANSSELDEIRSLLERIQPGDGRSSFTQSTIQLAAIVVTLLVSMITGMASGVVLMIPALDPIYEDDCVDKHCHQHRSSHYHDSLYWISEIVANGGQSNGDIEDEHGSNNNNNNNFEHTMIMSHD